MSRAALLFQAVLLIYLEAIEWIDLFPWNNVRNGNGQAGADIALGFVMAACLFSTLRDYRWAMRAASGFYAFWLWLQISTWWIPYFRGASEGWKRVHARYFASTVQIFPSAPNSLPPDACHFVLQVLITLALTATAVAAWRSTEPAPTPASYRANVV